MTEYNLLLICQGLKCEQCQENNETPNCKYLQVHKIDFCNKLIIVF